MIPYNTIQTASTSDFFQEFELSEESLEDIRELVEEGFNEVVGSDYNRILDSYNRIPERKCDYEKKLYGNGNAAALIAEALKKYL